VKNYTALLLCLALVGCGDDLTAYVQAEHIEIAEAACQKNEGLREVRAELHYCDGSDCAVKKKWIITGKCDNGMMFKKIVKEKR
jgi:hypothetical protein